MLAIHLELFCVTQCALRWSIYGWLLWQCGHKTTSGESTRGSHSSLQLLLPGFVLWLRCCSCNELKLGTETKADPSMSRQALRETILTDTQLQGYEKQTECSSQSMSEHWHTSLWITYNGCLGFYVTVLVILTVKCLSCAIFSTGSSSVAAATCYKSCYHQRLTKDTIKKEKTNGAETDKHKASFIECGPLFCLQYTILVCHMWKY